MFAYWRYSINKGDETLMKEGNRLIEKIEQYKAKNHRLPEYIEDLKLNLPDNYPLNYNRGKGSDNYVVSFQIGFFKDIVYHSDTRKWVKD
ncbi:MAG TPA: hypothetical protein VFE54_08870 [Mucilaginibacter sp.]|nr:hypothetical protein [Mucilaginibacter sp.]